MDNQSASGTPTSHAPHELAEQILDSAIRIAEGSSWESLRLHQIARDMDITLEVIQHFFRQKDDLVEAWYDRADRAMLADAALEDYQWLSPRERIHRSITCWLKSLGNHRRVSRDMLNYKLELGHIHLQVLGLLRISRTVQWILEAANREVVHLQRVGEEVALTGIYLATFTYWMFDDSTEAQKTTKLLDRLLRQAEYFARLAVPLGIHGYDPESQQKQSGTSGQTTEKAAH